MAPNLILFICSGLTIVILFVGGVIALVIGFRNRNKGTESQNWPSVSAVITQSKVKTDTDTDAEGFTSTTFVPEIEYEYHVGENVYSGNRISFGGTRSYGRRKKAEEALEAYPVNGQVTAYYNPENPEEVVLIQGTKGTMGAIIVGIALIAFSIMGTCIGIILLIANL